VSREEKFDSDGVQLYKYDYENGKKPSTNLIIHGHNMKSGAMFGTLLPYDDETFLKEHNKIKFSSLYEDREYEVISVFYSQVYNKSDDVFKFYKFFDAKTQEEFDDWYKNIKALSVYDTGVTAEFGDEFLTLTTCSFHVEDGRFVVVAKRVY
jgi:sortase B